ncbi:Conserved_hypothetical protein [Hexamita inflata]|uniref:Uncharacterized protein n=1 Tax=Hexamita inflata TaxID=28002 RepID=A0AA86Q215_9EUKA|nr:Conserved hypothetical protein [Hexamita inflata]
MQQQYALYPKYHEEIYKLLNMLEPTLENTKPKQEANILSSQMEKINVFQYMNVHKLLNELDIYLVIEDNYLYIVDKMNNVLEKYSVNYPYYQGYIDPKYRENLFSICNAQLYQSVLCEGTIYIQRFESVFCLRQCKLQLVFQIPNMNLSRVTSFYGRLFVFNNILHVHNNDGELYAYKPESGLKLVMSIRAHFFSFLDKAFVWNLSEDYIGLLTGEYSVNVILRTTADSVSCANGFLILHDENCSVVNILNMVTLQHQVTSNSEYSQDNIRYFMELDQIGLQLSSHFCLNQKQIENAYLNQNMNQRSDSVYMETVNELLPINTLLKFGQNAFNYNLERNQTTLKKLSETIRTGKWKIKTELENIAKKINKIANSYLIIGSGDTSQ